MSDMAVTGAEARALADPLDAAAAAGEAAATKRAGAAADVPPALDRRRFVLCLASLMTVIALAALDNNIVNTALPRMAASLGGLDRLPWVVTGFMLASTVTMPLYGKLSDLYGRRPMFTLAILIFLAGSLLCSLAQTLGQLVAFRVVQGLGAGGLIPLVMTSVGDIVPPRERGRYQGLFTAVFGAAALGGPALGGVLTDGIGWRSIFYVNVPIGLVALAMLRASLPATERRLHAIDGIGAVLVLAAAVPLLLALSWGGHAMPWTSGPICALFAAAAAGAALLWWHERRFAEPVIAVDLLPNRDYASAVAVTALIGLGFFGTITFIPLFLQQARGLSATASGLMIVPLIVGNMGSAVVGGRIVSRSGRFKPMMVIGMALVALGLAIMHFLIGADAATWTIGASMFVVGLGGGLGMPQLTVCAQNAVERRQLGSATSTLQFFNALAGASGAALAGATLSMGLWSALAPRLGPALTEAVLRAGTHVPAQHALLVDAYRGAMARTCLVGSLICAAAFLASLVVPDRELEGR